jgi:hypothetical protein
MQSHYDLSNNNPSYLTFGIVFPSPKNSYCKISNQMAKGKLSVWSLYQSNVLPNGDIQLGKIQAPNMDWGQFIQPSSTVLYCFEEGCVASCYCETWDSQNRCVQPVPPPDDSAILPIYLTANNDGTFSMYTFFPNDPNKHFLLFNQDSYPAPPSGLSFNYIVNYSDDNSDKNKIIITEID